ncbi:hypothetical protein LINPERHAP1_LOCUS20796 [Linum perenne]
MTNEERWRRRVTADASCPECKGSCEDTEHVLRRCDFAELVWREIQVKFWVHLYSSSWKTLQASRETSGIARQAHLIGWRPAGEGWFSLNSDGSLYTTNNAAAAGGVIRDGNGRFIKLLLLIWAFAPLCVLN